MIYLSPFNLEVREIKPVEYEPGLTISPGINSFDQISSSQCSSKAPVKELQQLKGEVVDCVCKRCITVIKASIC